MGTGLKENGNKFYNKLFTFESNIRKNEKIIVGISNTRRKGINIQKGKKRNTRYVVFIIKRKKRTQNNQIFSFR